MSFAGGLFLNRTEQHHTYIVLSALGVCAFVAAVLILAGRLHKQDGEHTVVTYVKSLYAMFLKPHRGDGEGQQSALESFYKTQVGRE